MTNCLPARVRLIEFSFHNAVVANLIFAMSGRARLDVHIRWRTQSDWKDEIGFYSDGFDAHVADATRSRSGASLFFYAEALKGLKDSDVLWISTGPESNILPDLAIFALLVAFGGRKIVLSIRNVERWIRGPGNGISQDLLRSWLLHRVNRVVLESEIQREAFIQDVRGFSGSTAVVPVFFSDVGKMWQGPTGLFEQCRYIQPRELRIGLLGGLDTTKRDYSELLLALEQLGPKLREGVTLSVLGSASIRGASAVLDSLHDSVSIERFGDYISNHTMVTQMRRCDVLIAPLRIDISYGRRKGTGSVGDAILCGKKLLLPSAIPVDAKLYPAIIPYESATDLHGILLSMIHVPKAHDIPSEILEEFTAATSFNRALSDLNLEELFL